jgi:hypothetical protein
MTKAPHATEKTAAAAASLNQPATQKAAQEQANATDEANRKAQEEAAAKDAEARARDNASAAHAQQVASEAFTVADRDPMGRAPGAANYDPPKLPVEPGTDAFHIAHPAEITSGQFNPREESAEERYKKQQEERDAAVKKQEEAAKEAQRQAEASRNVRKEKSNAE